jgi:hypothetical protein
VPTPVLVKKAGIPAPLGERPLRVEFQLQLAGQIQLGEQLVLADVGADHLPDLPAGQQHAQPEVVDAAVVGDHGQVLDARVADRRDQVLRDAAQPEAARHDRHAVEEHS